MPLHCYDETLVVYFVCFAHPRILHKNNNSKNKNLLLISKSVSSETLSAYISFLYWIQLKT